MKKVLLATTFLVGASMYMTAAAQAADPLELKITGYGKFETWFVDQDANAASSRGIHMELDDAELHFNVSGTADNGLTYALKIEQDIDASMATDEIRLRFSGAFGIIDLGSEDGASDLMTYGGENLLTGQGGWDGGPGSVLENLGLSTGPDLVGDTSDANKITYYTPRFAGVQVGASYTPDSGSDNSDTISNGDASQAANVFEAGINYTGDFSGVGVKLGLVGLTGDPDNDSNNTIEDYQSWAVGDTVSYMGFSLGAGYGDSGDSGQTKGSGADSGSFWDVAVGYANGPLKIGVGYLAAEADNTTGTGDSDVDFYTVGANYAVAPGLDVYAEYDYVDLKNPASTVTDGQNQTITKNDASIFMVGTKISF